MEISKKECELISGCLIDYIQEYDFQYDKDELEIINNFIDKLEKEWERKKENNEK